MLHFKFETALEERGFTGHEHLDEVGLIHMNGRIYDPTIGRFLQADPIIQDALDGQNYNRYSYVVNNPLSLTDPSGFSFWTKWRRTIFSIAAAFLVPWAVGSLLSNFAASTLTNTMFAGFVEGGTVALTSVGNAVAAAAGGFAAGGISGGNLQSAIIGAFTAGAQFGIGEIFGHTTPSVFQNAGLAAQKAVAHAAVGCASAAAAGGSCRAGAMSAGFSSLAGPLLPGGDAKGFHGGNFVGRMIVGAIGSKLGGGKYENGALTAAMGYLFNDVFIETTKQVFGLHKRVTVRNDNGDLLESFSFGVDEGKFSDHSAGGAQPAPGLKGSGVVYQDTDPTVATVERFKTSGRENLAVIDYMRSRQGDTGPYNVYTNSCRHFSDFEFAKIRFEIEKSRLLEMPPKIGGR